MTENPIVTEKHGADSKCQISFQNANGDKEICEVDFKETIKKSDGKVIDGFIIDNNNKIIIGYKFKDSDTWDMRGNNTKSDIDKILEEIKMNKNNNDKKSDFKEIKLVSAIHKVYCFIVERLDNKGKVSLKHKTIETAFLLEQKKLECSLDIKELKDAYNQIHSIPACEKVEYNQNDKPNSLSTDVSQETLHSNIAIDDTTTSIDNTIHLDEKFGKELLTNDATIKAEKEWGCFYHFITGNDGYKATDSDVMNTWLKLVSIRTGLNSDYCDIIIDKNAINDYINKYTEKINVKDLDDIANIKQDNLLIELWKVFIQNNKNEEFLEKFSGYILDRYCDDKKTQEYINNFIKCENEYILERVKLASFLVNDLPSSTLLKFLNNVPISILLLLCQGEEVHYRVNKKLIDNLLYNIDDAVDDKYNYGFQILTKIKMMIDKIRDNKILIMRYDYYVFELINKALTNYSPTTDSGGANEFINNYALKLINSCGPEDKGDNMLLSRPVSLLLRLLKIKYNNKNIYKKLSEWIYGQLVKIDDLSASRYLSIILQELYASNYDDAMIAMWDKLKGEK